ncbi:MAG: hypothetical protein IJT85_05240 [Ruminococcus sp.]|nr:hypothetical protein [Ruminococcus sp.]
MRYLIADLVTEFTPRYDETRRLAEPFEYNGERKTDIRLNISEKYLSNLMSKSAKGSTIEKMENFALSGAFNRGIIAYNTMLVHSSALIYNNGAYLFSGNSGVGKSTHTRLWLKAFGDRVHIMNDDKPVVRIYDDKAVAYGTPFDGGSGIALNENYPLKAIIFIERAEENSIRIPGKREIIQRLYFQTARMIDRDTAERLLLNIEKLLQSAKFFVLSCNTDISAAYLAFDYVVESKKT